MAENIAGQMPKRRGRATDNALAATANRATATCNPFGVYCH